MQLNRAAITADVTTQIYTNTQRLIKGNTVRDRFVNVIDSFLNTIDDRNVNNGFLGLDNNGLVDVSFIQAPTPSGNFLRDDGTWQAIAAGGYIPLAGTDPGSPLAGHIEYSRPGMDGAAISSTDSSFYVGTSDDPEIDNGSYGNNIYFGAPTPSQRSNIFLGGYQSNWQSRNGSKRSSVSMNASFNWFQMSTFDGSNSAEIYGDLANILVAGSDPAFGGLVGYGDYSANYTSLHYVQKGWVSSTFVPYTGANTVLFNGNEGIDTATAAVLNIGATNANVINYGNASTVHNFLGTAIYEMQVNSYVNDKLFTLNHGGSVASGIGVGFEIEENSAIAGYFKTDSARAGWLFKAPASFPFQLKLNNLTASRAGTIQDSTGTFAWLSDIPAAQNLSSVLTAGNSTGNQAIQSPDTTGQLLVGDGGTSIGYYGVGGNAYAYYAPGAIILSATTTTINGLTNIGNASAAAQRQLRVGQDSSVVDIGSLVGTTSSPAIYFNQTPTSNNYAFTGTSTRTAINATSDLRFRVGGFDRLTINDIAVIFTPTSTVSGASTTFQFTKPNNTNQTASTNVPGWQYIAGSRQWATGPIGTQIEVDWQAVTWSAVGASVFTNGYGHYFRQPIAGANVTVTNSYAVGVGGYLQVQPGSISGQGIVLRDYFQNSAQSAIYMGVAPGNNNHALRGDGASNTFVNSDNQVFISLSGTTRLSISPTFFSFASMTAATSGAITSYSFNRSTNTGQTASTAISSWSVSSFGRTWANGGAATTITTQTEHDWGAGTYATSGGGSLAFTTIYAHKFRAATLGASVTAGANYAAGFDGNVEVAGNISFPTLGNGLKFTTGANQRAGKATLVSGTVTVSNTTITANSIVILSGITSASASLSYTISAGTGFTINSTLLSDNRAVSYLIIELN